MITQFRYSVRRRGKWGTPDFPDQCNSGTGDWVCNHQKSIYPEIVLWYKRMHSGYQGRDRWESSGWYWDATHYTHPCSSIESSYPDQQMKAGDRYQVIIADGSFFAVGHTRIHGNFIGWPLNVNGKTGLFLDWWAKEPEWTDVIFSTKWYYLLRKNGKTWRGYWKTAGSSNFFIRVDSEYGSRGSVPWSVLRFVYSGEWGWSNGR